MSKETNTGSFISKRLQAILTLLRSRIRKEDAAEHIKNYRQNLGPDTIKSVWIDREIIDEIITKDPMGRISGLRVYLARYKEGIYPVTEDSTLKDQPTLIIALTGAGEQGPNTDFADGYFNYGVPCPPRCQDNGDVIN